MFTMEDSDSDLGVDFLSEDAEAEKEVELSEGEDVDPEEEEAEDDIDEPPAPTKAKRGAPKKNSNQISCHIVNCAKTFRTLKSYHNHLKLHLVDDLLRTGPGYAALQQAFRDNSVGVLEQGWLEHVLKDKPKLMHGISGEVGALCSALLSMTPEERNLVVDCVSDYVIPCFPPPSLMTLSKFHFEFTKNIIKVMNDLPARDAFLNVLRDLVGESFSEGVMNFFRMKFSSSLAESVECFYLKFIREPREVLLYGYNPNNSEHKTSDNLDDVNFQQTIHYIGGSCVRSVIGISYRYKNNEKWKRISDVARSHMLVGSLVTGPSEDVVAWTNARDRGGLKFISQAVWCLLMALSGILTKNEETCGINIENVYRIFYSDEHLMKSWDEIIQGQLDKEENNCC